MRVLGSAMPVPWPAVTTLRAELRPVPDVGGGQRTGSDRRQAPEPVAARSRLPSTAVKLSPPRPPPEAYLGLASLVDQDRHWLVQMQCYGPPLPDHPPTRRFG